MIRRVAAGIVAFSLLAGCGADKDYNTLPPETLAAKAPIKKTPKRRITKPPVAHRALPTQPIR